MSKLSLCPVCAGAKLLPMFSAPALPLSGRLPITIDSQVPCRTLHLDYCPACAFFCQPATDEVSIDYADVARPTARQLPAYAMALLERLAEQDKNALLIEVGSNDGTFLNALRQAGFVNLLGIEPSTALAANARVHGHAIENAPLDLALAESLVAKHGKAQTLVCRHTVEHVPDFMGFLKAMHALLANEGLACIEVPSALPIIEALHIHEIWDEHVNYFLPENFTLALTQSGFEIVSMEVKPFREMQNLIAWLRPAVPEKIAAVLDTKPPLPEQRYADLCASFAQRLRPVCEALHQRVAASPTPRVVMGASHPQANFLNISGLAPLISAAIDDDPNKALRWLPLKGGNVSINPSSELSMLLANGTLLLTGFGYPAWMEQARQAAGNEADIIDLTFPMAGYLV